MIRWLAPGGEVSSASSEYAQAEQRMRSLAARLLDGARSADGTIAF